ncbi:MAG: nitrate/nitrite transporter NrtS [Alphaproteobacteria bacterium]
MQMSSDSSYLLGIMETLENGKTSPGFVALATENGTLTRSIVTGVVVGTILSAINQGDILMAGEIPSLFKIILNYVVPYCVATYGAVTAKQHTLRKDND